MNYPFKKGDTFKSNSDNIIFKRGGIVYLHDNESILAINEDQLKEFELDYYLRKIKENITTFKLTNHWYLPVCKFCHKSECPTFDLEPRILR